MLWRALLSRDRALALVRDRPHKETGIAILIVDQDFEALLAVCDRGLILAKGVVVYAGTAMELAANPEVHARFLGCDPAPWIASRPANPR